MAVSTTYEENTKTDDSKTNAITSSTKAANTSTAANLLSVMLVSRGCDLSTKKVVPRDVDASAEPYNAVSF